MAKKTVGGAKTAHIKTVKKEKKPTDKLADKTALTKFLQGVFGDAQKKVLKRLWKRAQEITKLEPKYEKMSDKELAAQTDIFKKKIEKALKTAKTEEDIKVLLKEAIEKIDYESKNSKSYYGGLWKTEIKEI